MPVWQSVAIGRLRAILNILELLANFSRIVVAVSALGSLFIIGDYANVCFTSLTPPNGEASSGETLVPVYIFLAATLILFAITGLIKVLNWRIERTETFSEPPVVRNSDTGFSSAAHHPSFHT